VHTYDQLKDIVLSRADELATATKELALQIYNDPETSGKEYQSSVLIASFLEEQGFDITAPYADLPTAFKASIGHGQTHIALLGEYDALPDIGHGCGHNLIAAASTLAACALLPVLETIGGRLSVIGTPSEEQGSRKIDMIENGAFEDIQMAMISHPTAIHDVATIFSYANTDVWVTFHGKEAHAAASPEQGINALDALILSFNAINALRQQLKSDVRIHGIILKGGEAANIIPSLTKAHFMVRSKNGTYLKSIIQKVGDIFRGAALQTGCTANIDIGHTCLNMKNNKAMAETYIQSMAELGQAVDLRCNSLSFGSTDMGNVSHLIPSIHPLFAISDEELTPHTTSFCLAAGSSQALEAMVQNAKGLALTALKMYIDKDLCAKAQEDFQEQV